MGLLFCRKLSVSRHIKDWSSLVVAVSMKSLCVCVCVCVFFFLKVYAGLLVRASNMTEKVTDTTAGRQVMFNHYYSSLYL